MTSYRGHKTSATTPSTHLLTLLTMATDCKFVLDLDIAPAGAKQPFPEGFTLKDLHDASKREKIMEVYAEDAEEFEDACDFLKEETGESYGIVFVDCDVLDNNALTFEEAKERYPDVRRGAEEPGDDSGYQWFSVTENTGFPDSGSDVEAQLAIMQRYLAATPDAGREAQVYEALTRFLASRTSVLKSA